jgi:membrane-bound lytic murein transglycosylase B
VSGGLWPEAERRGISRAVFDAHVGKLTPDLKIMDLLEAQPEYTTAIWTYLDQHVAEDRIKRGREFLARHRPVFDAVEKAYGVDRHILAAISGVETNYGAASDDRPVIRSTATLTCIGRRQNRFRAEFLAALEILQRGEIRADRLKGEWAGAFGPTGFIPSSFQRFAVDFDGDGRRDVVDSIPDMLASTANNLKQDGWISAESWGQEVVLPSGFNYLLADSWRWNYVREWQRLGIAPAGGKPLPRPDAVAYLSLPAGSAGPAFLLSQNFRVLLRYNPAHSYALAVGHLADRLRGEGPFAHSWPRSERVLSGAERFEVQQLLARRGFDIGGQPDGLIGPRSRSAIQRFQASAGMVPDGFASAAVLNRLRLQ